jgi:hypothetical protein
MKATVSTGQGLSYKSVEVEISAIQKMSPKAAKSFSRVAFGHALGTMVCGGGKAYRCTRSGVRALKPRR